MHGPLNVKRETCLVRNGIRALDQAARSLVTMAPELSRAIDKTVSRGIFTVQSGVQFQTIPCRRNVEQRNAGIAMSHSTSVSPIIIIPTGSILIHLSVSDDILKLSCYRPRQEVEALGICRKSAH
jgi:hypothetical protein